ncbi:hypothetical protein AGMMS49545_12200 [Betaproteobacteria bacterium]|nr:hypothetical protein AGMMS49545_12200 [Betaproteobacteria bacterium]GHU42673.1 hypothetical protein AGMMS50289_07780 [Betaproteobacteria bacterium]
MCKRNSVLNRCPPSPQPSPTRGVGARRAVPLQPCLTKSGIGDFISIHAIALPILTFPRPALTVATFAPF